MDKKSLILFRHGKSEWDAPSGHDFDRPLAEKGVVDARTMGRFLRDAGAVPDIVISSSALRAQSTAKLAAETGKWNARMEVTDTLYDTSSASVLKLIHTLPNSANCALLAGHEPTFSELVAKLTGGGRVKLSTSAMAQISFPVRNWMEIHPGGGTLHWLMQVRLLG